MPRSLVEIRQDLQNPELVPGSDQERLLLDEARDARKHDTDEFAIIKKGELEAAAAEHGIITKEAAQHAGQVAVEQVTGEYQIPVQVGSVPAVGPAPGEIFDQERH